MTYSGLTIETTVHDSSLSSHAIPAYPEYDSATTFDDAFYAERRAECDALIGAAVDYQDDPNQGGSGGGGGAAVDISDAAISGPTSLTQGNNSSFSLNGLYEDDYVNDYHVVWSVPAGEATLWKYNSDTTDMLIVLATSLSAGTGNITCTLTERGNSANFRTITKTVTTF